MIGENNDFDNEDQTEKKHKIETDPKLLRMILDNLLSNAVKYTLPIRAMTEIEDTLKNGTPAAKKEVLYELRSNLTVTKKTLNVSNRKSINAFAECILRAKSENEAFEPKKTFFTEVTKGSKRNQEVFSSVYKSLLRG